MSKTILGIFYDRSQAENAILDLENNGYDTKDFSIMMRDTQVSQDLSSETGASDVVGGTTSGIITGGILGGLAGLVASYFIPGLGAFFIGGPVVAALGLTGIAATAASGAVTGAAAGGILGALMSLGLSHDDAKIYEEGINQGGILLAVPARLGEEAEVEEIMQEYGADQIRAIDNPDTTYRVRDMREMGRTPAYYSEVKKKRRVSRR